MSASLAEFSVVCNATLSLEVRLALWILISQDRIGNHFVPLTQDAFAAMAATQHTAISTVAAAFKPRRPIAYGHGAAEVLDRDGLVAIACDAYAAAHAMINEMAPQAA